ncbi:tight adherence protein C [Palleronia aestuarii]|uniref:Tight adherence protein C n=1 Tax=Palleronia aestuarii TaxID=568105 RepID=A0A2W7NNH9_9RHOB|nr:type II secretion system F family protein [Palleronia aestuarii]PZX19677.1 tight adherence protein C [Palleronia aestuarii]
MTPILDMLTALFGPLGPLLAVGMAGLLMIAVSLSVLLKRRPDPMDKFHATVKAKSTRTEGGPGLRVAGSGARQETLQKYSSFLVPQDEAEYSAARLKMIQAGYRGKNAVMMFHFFQFSLGIGLLIAGLVFALLDSANGSMTTQSMILWVLVPGGIGYMAPRYWVTKRIQQRREEIANGFPDSLDMMLVCVEAGQSMDHSIARVAKEIRAGYPALAEEFEIVSNEIRAGKDRTAVLRDMAERAGVTDISNFVTVLIQSATFGTSIAEALRVYAAEMRDKRVMRAEEKANTLPTKMTLATMMLTVPPLLIILLGPSVYGVVVTLGELSQ